MIFSGKKWGLSRTFLMGIALISNFVTPIAKGQDQEAVRILESSIQSMVMPSALLMGNEPWLCKSGYWSAMQDYANRVNNEAYQDAVLGQLATLKEGAPESYGLFVHNLLTVLEQKKDSIDQVIYKLKTKKASWDSAWYSLVGVSRTCFNAGLVLGLVCVTEGALMGFDTDTTVMASGALVGMSIPFTLTPLALFTEDMGECASDKLSDYEPFAHAIEAVITLLRNELVAVVA